MLSLGNMFRNMIALYGDLLGAKNLNEQCWKDVIRDFVTSENFEKFSQLQMFRNIVITSNFNVLKGINLLFVAIFYVDVTPEKKKLDFFPFIDN